jgi:iron(III) transport system ATP-binding protein
MSATPILQLDRLTKTFDCTSTPALNQISLTLQPGEILGLLGPSGCGKTTLLRLIAGFEQPQAGEIHLDGHLIATSHTLTPPEQRDIGMVFQDYALFPHLTVSKNVAFGLQQPKHKKFSPQQIKELTQKSIALVGLAGLNNRYPHELSGGQQQRVALARAIAPQPALILLDEPLSNLDIQVRSYLRQEIRSILKTAGTTAIFVTHDQEEALSICDRIAVMQQGHLEQIDSPEALYHHPKSRFVAEFVTQANFLPAHCHNRHWQTEIGSFPNPNAAQDPTQDSAQNVAQNSAQNSAQDTAALMIRQEDLQLIRDDHSRLVIRDRQFLGREYRYWIITPSGRSLYARSPIEHHSAQNSISVGDYVKAIVHPNAIQVFSA